MLYYNIFMHLFNSMRCSVKRLLLTMVLIVAGCLSARASEPPSVVASIPPIHGLVSMVTDGVVEPTLLFPGSVSPHAYHLKPSDAAVLESADIVFWISPTMETALAKPMQVIAGNAIDVQLMDARGLQILPRREGGMLNHGEEQEEQGSDEEREVYADPHIWLNPVNAIVMLFVISETLGDLDPGNAALYRANAISGIATLKTLDSVLEGRLASVRGAPYVAFHDAYQYFEDRYGLKPLATMAVDPEHAPGARRLSEVRDAVAQSGARCVFSEPQFDPRLLVTLTEGTGAKVSPLDPIGLAIEPGPAFYPALLTQMVDDLVGCLAVD